MLRNPSEVFSYLVFLLLVKFLLINYNVCVSLFVSCVHRRAVTCAQSTTGVLFVCPVLRADCMGHAMVMARPGARVFAYVMGAIAGQLALSHLQ